MESCWGQRAGDEGTAEGNGCFIVKNEETQEGIALASIHPSLGQMAPRHFTVPGVGASHVTGLKETIYRLGSFVLPSARCADGERIVLMKGKQLCKGEF